MKKGYQIILWGIGVHYNRMKRVIDYYEMTKQFRVVALTDREKFPFSQLDGYKIIEKNELQYIDFDYLIVLSDKYFDDISIHCNHTADPKEAISNWNRRNELVNFENLFVEMYTENVDIAEQFETLEKYEKRICFVPYDVKDKNHLAQLHILSNQSEFWETVNANATIGKNAIEYNLLDLLLYGKIKYRGRINL